MLVLVCIVLKSYRHFCTTINFRTKSWGEGWKSENCPLPLPKKPTLFTDECHLKIFVPNTARGFDSATGKSCNLNVPNICKFIIRVPFSTCRTIICVLAIDYNIVLTLQNIFAVGLYCRDEKRSY